MPRDAGGRVFALDERTGRLVWDNTLVLGVELVGVFEDTLIVRGQTALAALALETGKDRWYLPITNSVLARAQLIVDAVYLANSDSLQQLDAHTGKVQATRSWDLNDERPHGFTIAGSNLYVVTDKPAEDEQQRLREPLNPEVAPANPLALPLKRSWSLPRSNALVSLPPAASPLSGKGYLLCGGILECIDVSAQGAIRWRRFVNARAAHIHFVGTTLLIVERGTSRAPGMSNRLVAFDGEQGNSLWDTPIADNLNQLVLCDSMLVFYNNRGRILAVDSASGERAWERDVQGQLTALSWDGSGLHGIYVPQWKYARHLTLDPASGQSLSESTVETQTESMNPRNGKRLRDGYYEVAFDPVDVRYVRLVALSEINYGRWTSIAELQVVGSDGENISRKNWRTVKVDSVETQSRYNTTPEAAFDSDPVTWWHTKWIGGIPPHPHEIQIDLGSRQKINGIRYLPAVIINNNGMIRDYELFASNDTTNWGAPVAKGVLVNRVRIERPMLAEKAVYFEAPNRPQNTREVFRYDLDGKPAKKINDNGRLETVRGKYVVMSVRRDNKDILTVLRSDDPSYRYELTSEYPLHRDGEILIEGDRLILGRRSLVVADLARRRFIVPPTKDDQRQNRPGMLLREGADNLLKIVSLGGEGQLAILVDMNSGELTEAKLAEQAEPFRDDRPGGGRMLHFDDVLLLTDGSSVSAWIRGDEVPATN